MSYTICSTIREERSIINFVLYAEFLKVENGMNFRCVIFLSGLFALLFSGLAGNAGAVVAQSGSSALSNDIFVKGRSSDSGRTKESERREREARKRQEAREQKAAEERAKIERKRQELLKTRRSLQNLEDIDCPNRQVQVFEGGKLVDTYTKSNVSAKKREIDNELRRLDEQSAKLSGSAASQVSTPAESSNPEAGPAYAKHYASKLFQTYSGHITIEQKNIPRKIAITKGSTVQLNLAETKDAIWHIETNDKVAKVKSNAVQGDKRIVIFEGVGKGNAKLLLDNISVKPNDYKVLVRKRMLLIVD